MRHNQRVGFKYFIIIQENIQIQSPRSPVDQTFAVCQLLHAMQLIQKLLRIQKRPELQTGIQKIILLHTAVRLCNQVGRHFFYLAAFIFLQLSYRVIQICLLVSQVGAQCDIRGMPEPSDFHRHRFQRKSDRCPRLLQFQLYSVQERIGKQQCLCQLFCCSFYELARMLRHKVHNKMTDLPIIGR